MVRGRAQRQEQAPQTSFVEAVVVVVVGVCAVHCDESEARRVARAAEGVCAHLASCHPLQR